MIILHKHDRPTPRARAHSDILCFSRAALVDASKNRARWSVADSGHSLGHLVERISQLILDDHSTCHVWPKRPPWQTMELHMTGAFLGELGDDDEPSSPATDA